MQNDGWLRWPGPIVLLFILIVLGVSPGRAQEKSLGEIVGRVVDDSTNTPIVSANVFIANSMMGTATDTVGRFQIRSVTVGSHELVASCVGYRMVSSRIIVGLEPDVRIEIRLQPILIAMQSVEVTAPPPEMWMKSLERFKVLLLGSTEEAKACQILNPEVLDFESDGTSHLSARADRELVVLNPVLGYRISVSIASFLMQDGWVSCDWKARFEELSSTASEEKEKWSKNREKAFRGSLHHFLRSLVLGDMAHSGFVMLNSTSPRFEQKKRDLYFEKDVDDVLRRIGPDEWEIQFDDYLIVQNERINVDVFGGHTRMSQRPKTSTLALVGKSLRVDSRGQLLDRLALRVSGDWGKEGLANEVPLDFEPASGK